MSALENMNEQEQMQMLMSQLQDSHLRQSVLQYINQTASGLDKDASNKTLIETLARESVHNQKNTALWKARTRKSAVAGVVAVVLAITVQFLVNYFTNELSKESHVDKQGAMVSTDGKMVKTQMEEMKVDADGKLLSRNGDSSIKTMPTLAKVALTSSLPDATLMALDEITVHSDKGFTLQMKVHGFSRVPVLNSRCGNVVHFYTAWKGKVTLDSTDLSFDEATAAEFQNAGFSLATGGRRLSGKISVDGFAKAIDGVKQSGKWSCADVPLPTFSEIGDRKETSYAFCGTKDDKESLCYSKYGGLKMGVTALEGGLASAVASKTAQVRGQRSNELYMKSSSAVMNSDLYRVSFSEYAMHPGQQLVVVSDVQAGTAVRFQIESDNSRSHCTVEADQMEQTNHKAQRDGKVDSDWHFEYMGTSEEEGQVLRHFRLMLSGEYTQYVLGDASKASLPNFAEYWDVAETMEPRRFLLGDGAVTVFDDYKQGMSDAEVIKAVQVRTGKTIAQLMSCSDAEKSRTQRPEMDLFADLTTDDADYYGDSSAPKSPVLAKYLDSAGNSYAVPDMCYESCASTIEAVRSQGDSCHALSAALECLQETGKSDCQTSRFVEENYAECDSNNKSVERSLEEAEESVELLVNESRVAKAASESRNLLSFKCNSENGKVTRMGDGWCVQWEWELKKGSFNLMIKWGIISGYYGLCMELSFCIDLSILFGIPPPLYAEICIGGGISVTLSAPCPEIPLNINGYAYFSFDIGLDFWICKISFANITLGFEAGIGWLALETKCQWVKNPGNGRRRWWRRRRNKRTCNYKEVCDIYVKGYVTITIAIVRATLEFVYWVKSEVLEIFIHLYAWFFKWWQAYSRCIYRRQF